MLKVFLIAYTTKNKKYGATLEVATDLNSALDSFKKTVPDYFGYEITEATPLLLQFFDYKRITK